MQVRIMTASALDAYTAAAVSPDGAPWQKAPTAVRSFVPEAIRMWSSFGASGSGTSRR